MRGRGSWLLRALGLGLFAWLVGRSDWAELGRVLKGVDSTLLYVLPLLTAIMIGLRAWRWNLMLKVRQQGLSPGRVWSIYSIGLFLGSVTPGRLGDLAKAWYVRSEGELSWDQALAGALTDRLFDVGFMGVLAIWAIFQLDLGGLLPLDWFVASLGGGLGFALFFGHAADFRPWCSTRAKGSVSCWG